MLLEEKDCRKHTTCRVSTKRPKVPMRHTGRSISVTEDKQMDKLMVKKKDKGMNGY